MRVHARVVAALQSAHHGAHAVNDLDGGRLAGGCRQPVVEVRPVFGIHPDGGIVVGNRGRGDRPESIRIAGREQVRTGRHHLRGQLLQRREIVEDPEAAPVGAHPPGR